MSDERREQPMEGRLGAFSLRELLHRLADRGATGILTVQSDRDILAVSLEDGKIVGADALNETLEEGLGRALTSEGLLTAAEFSRVLERVHLERVRLADVLVEEELLARPDYLAAVRRYTLELIRRATDWEAGDYKFYPGEEVSFEEGFEPIWVAELGAEGEPAPVASEGSAEPASAAEAAASEPSGAARPRAAAAARGVEAAAEGEAPPVPVTWLMSRLDAAPRWIAWVAPTLVVLLLAGVVIWRPNSILYPFFWLEPERLELEGERRASVYQKIDRAAKTFFLIEGRFPDDLHTLVVRGLLAPRDIVDARGRILTYVPADRGYVIRAAGADGTDLGVNKLEAIAGDFLLDPEFVVRDRRRDTVPLVLLD